MNVKGFFSVDSEDVVAGVVFGGLPKVKPTGLPRLPPEVPGVVVAVDPPKVNFAPVDGNPPNGEGVGVGLSELVPPKIPAEDVGAPNPPNGLAGFSALVLPNPPKTLAFSEVPDDPKGECVVDLSFSLSSLSPNTEVVDGPPNGFVVVEEDPPKRVPEDIELEDRFPNDEVGLGLSVCVSSPLFLAREDAKKFGMEGDLLSEPALPPKPNVGAGGPPEDSEVGAGVVRNASPVDGFELSVVVGGVKPLGFEPNEGAPELVDFNPEVVGGVGVDNLGAGVVVDEGALDKLGELNRTDGPGSGPSGSVFLGEFLKEPVSCLSHTDWMARRLAAY